MAGYTADKDALVKRLKRIEGQVPSPTPMVGVSGDSTTVILSADGVSNSAASTQAVNHPAVPPPTITTRWVAGLVWGDALLNMHSQTDLDGMDAV